MHASLTSEQILSLAADKYAIRTARTWSTREKWLRTGQDQDEAGRQFAWGEFKGKSKTPIQTMVSLESPIFSCTCKGRKLPCSHALGLRILYAEAPYLFPNAIPKPSKKIASAKPSPEDNKWLGTLTDEGTISTYLIEPASAHAELQQDEQDRARLQRIRKGLDELDLWLGDVVRNGLESVRDKKRAADWQRMARRLVDAQASELSSSVRKLVSIPGSTPNWPEELLARMGSLHLLVEGFRNFDTLPLEVQGDLRLAVGWRPKVEPTPETTLVDRWHVVARYQEMVGKRRRHKIWLWGEESNRPALLAHILTNKQMQIETLAPGMVVVGGLHFYPSMAPLRAELVGASAIGSNKDNGRSETYRGMNEHATLSIEQPERPVAGFADLDAAFGAINHAFAQNPWMTEYPIMVQTAQAEQVVSGRQSAYDAQVASAGILFKTATRPNQPQWVLTDSSGIRLPLPEKFEYGWHLRAMHGGGGNGLASGIKGSTEGTAGEQPNGNHLFGIWNRNLFTPYTIWQNNRWLSLHVLKGES